MANILLVEDEMIISEPFGIVLRSQKHVVDIAANGREAYDYCQKKTYDLILLDLMMPVCNGVEFLKKANLMVAAPNTKVIVLSNLTSGKELEEALGLGVEKNVLKASINPMGLIELVNDALK